MQATDILIGEHRVIEQVLSCLERMTDQAAMAGALDWAAAKDAVTFLQVFADQCHHHKEEEHLFPMLEARGFSRAYGPTGVMLDEHEQGRRYVRAMAEAVADGLAGNPKAIERFIEYAEAYIPLLRQHILKEELRLFPMANRTLTEVDQDQLLDAMERVENVEMPRGVHERYLEIANRLADRYGVPRAAKAAAGHGCCHHGIR